jgi:tRNA threonylcarbamoyladenosine biosynthesis protein TsaE
VKRIVYEARKEADTDKLGSLLSAALPDGTVVALRGTLGAGKTRLVRAVAAASGIDPRDVVSPTFVLAQAYRGDRTISHFDAYRLQGDDEFSELGPEEYFLSSGITFVEWAERVERSLPPEHVDVHIHVTGETSRRFEITAVGKTYEPVIDRLDKDIRS